MYVCILQLQGLHAARVPSTSLPPNHCLLTYVANSGHATRSLSISLSLSTLYPRKDLSRVQVTLPTQTYTSEETASRGLQHAHSGFTWIATNKGPLQLAI
jgi:hypothetical protein